VILVTGATGVAGSQVVRALERTGAPMRAFVRDPLAARDRLGGEVELAVGDLADPESVRRALDGADTVFLSCADDPRRVGWETALIDAAGEAGVRRIVKLSTIGAEPGAPVAFWDWHGRVEQHLLASEVPAVLLRSSFFMSNLLASAASVAAEGVLVAPAGEARIAMVDPRDVGAAAAALLAGAGEDAETYLVTGPEAITFADVAAGIAGATGRPVAFVDVPESAARAGLIESGVPEFVADQLVAIFGQLRAGAAAEVTDTVRRLTGTEPRSFAAFARDHARMFEPAGVAVGR
jgi:uncharacterized protein YbjT (DUF2867 family)